jgi:hypothetical protein
VNAVSAIIQPQLNFEKAHSRLFLVLSMMFSALARRLRFPLQNIEDVAALPGIRCAIVLSIGRQQGSSLAGDAKGK